MGRVEEVLTKMNVEAANIAAELASKKVQEIAEMATDTFYKGYDPEQYGRSYGLYAASQPYIKKINAPGTAQGGVITSPDGMPGYYHQRTDVVYDWDFVGGEHGGRKVVPVITKPSPYKLIKNTVATGEDMIAAECIEEAVGIVNAKYGNELAEALAEDITQGVK